MDNKKTQNIQQDFPIGCEYNDNAQLLYMIKQKISEIAYLYNYKTHDSPILTNADGYSGCGGGRDGMMRVVTENDVLALRSDLTGQFNKYMSSISKNGSQGPWKRLDIGKVFRNEKKISTGTKREFYQMDLDVADKDLPIDYDIESISCLYEALKSIFSLLNVNKTFTVQLNNTKIIKTLMESIGIDPEYTYKDQDLDQTYFSDFLSLLDNYYKSNNRESFYNEFKKGVKEKFKISDEEKINNLIGVLEKLMKNGGDVIEVIRNEELFQNNEEIINELALVYNGLLEKNIRVKYNPFIARKGYDGTIFETIIDNETESLGKSICSGGRFIIKKDINLIGMGGSIGATRLIDFLGDNISNNEIITAYPGTKTIKTQSGKILVDLMRGNGFSVEQMYTNKEERKEKIVLDAKDGVLDILLNFSFDPQKLSDKKYVAMMKDIQSFIKKYNKDFVNKDNQENNKEESIDEYLNEGNVKSNINLDNQIKNKLESISDLSNIYLQSEDKEILEKIENIRVFLCPLYDKDGGISDGDEIPELYAKKMGKANEVIEEMNLSDKKVNYIFADMGLLSNLGDKANKDKIMQKNMENYEGVITQGKSEYSMIKSSTLMNKSDEKVNINNKYTIEEVKQLLKEFEIDFSDTKVKDIIDGLLAQFGSYNKVYVLIYNYLSESKFFYEKKPNSMIVLPEKVKALIDLYSLSKDNCTKNSLLVGIQL